MVSKPITTDPRAELVDWDVIDLSEPPPVDQWTDEDWEDAILGTIAHRSRAEREQGRAEPLISFEEILSRRGLSIEDLQ